MAQWVEHRIANTVGQGGLGSNPIVGIENSGMKIRGFTCHFFQKNFFF